MLIILEEVLRATPDKRVAGACQSFRCPTTSCFRPAKYCAEILLSPFFSFGSFTYQANAIFVSLFRMGGLAQPR